MRKTVKYFILIFVSVLCLSNSIIGKVTVLHNKTISLTGAEAYAYDQSSSIGTTITITDNNVSGFAQLEVNGTLFTQNQYGVGKKTVSITAGSGIGLHTHYADSRYYI